MLRTFDKLTSVLKVRLTKILISTPVFRLHYRATFLITIACSILVTSRQFFGGHIDCVQNDAGVATRILNTYCFIAATFTVPKFSSLLDPMADDQKFSQLASLNEEQDQVKYHAYYQWVPFALFAQGLLFYAPYALWKAWEGAKITSIVQGLNVFDLRSRKEVRGAKEQILAKYLQRTLHHHNAWAVRYHVCMLANLVNVVGQIWFVDWFLDGEFRTYGWRVFKFLEGTDPEDRLDPMAAVFPKMTKCTFHKFGPSGSVNKHDALCILALNIINEKIYVLLWFWFVLLTLVTAVDFAYRLLVLYSSGLRAAILGRRLAAARRNRADLLIQRFQFGDFVLADLLGQNLDQNTFSNVFEHLAVYLIGDHDLNEDTPIMA